MAVILSFDQAAEALLGGQVGVFPTDTLYGLVARANDESAVRRLYELKHREHKPGTMIAASIDQLVELGITRRYLVAVASFWPGALSVVVPVLSSDLEYLHMGKQSLAIRIPDDEAILAVLEKTGPLITSSANMPGEPPANTVDEAKEYFGASVDFYVDGGNLAGRLPSTVVRIVDDAIEVLRPGAVTVKE